MRKSRQLLQNQMELIRELQETNQLLKSMPEQLAKSSGTVTIQTLNIKQATLDKLLFQLEKIDVKDLSGTLNLGNNFQLDKAERHSSQHELSGLRHLKQIGANLQKSQDSTAQSSGEEMDESSGGSSFDERVKQTQQGFVVNITGE